MVIKLGFISNSSSSSFVILGHETSFQKDWLRKCENVWCVGNFLYEGRDIFELTPKIAQIIWNDRIDVELSYYQANKIIYEDSEDFVKREELPEQFQVFVFEKDNHGTQDVREFKERYVKKR